MERTFENDSKGVKINMQLSDRVGTNQEVRLDKHKNSFLKKMIFVDETFVQRNPRHVSCSTAN